MVHQPNESPVEIAAARRFVLARDWLTASQVIALIGLTATDPEQLRTLRQQARILGAWDTTERCFRYPQWQFGLNGEPVRQMPEILGLLRKVGGMAVDDRPSAGWSEVEWFLASHGLLGHRSPAELLIADPGRVLNAAFQQFVADSDAGGF